MPSPPSERTCEHCGSPWTTRSLRARTCSPKCRAQLREREQPTKGRPPRDYPQHLIDQVLSLYEAGTTIREIDAVIGHGYRAQTIVERFVNQRRPAVPRDQTGERNSSWRGSEAGYQAFHLRVEAARGRPSRCACCDCTDPNQRYEWANLSGRYDDIRDYARLCLSCHRRLDAARRMTTGRRTSPPKGGDANV